MSVIKNKKYNAIAKRAKKDGYNESQIDAIFWEAFKLAYYLNISINEAFDKIIKAIKA